MWSTVNYPVMEYWLSKCVLEARRADESKYPVSPLRNLMAAIHAILQIGEK